jgi:hypothetical protein
MVSDKRTKIIWDLPETPELGIVDVCHGRLVHERRLRSTYGIVVHSNGILKKEKGTIGDATGDYTVDYDSGRVTFDVDQGVNAEIRISYSEVRSSSWRIIPAANKMLRLTKAELQFTEGARMNDTFVFQLYAKYGQCPYFPEGLPVPAGTLLPLGEATYYQTVFDLIVEANLAYPVIPKTKLAEGEQMGLRDLPDDVRIFSWDYEEGAASIDLISAYGMEAELRLENDLPQGGSGAVATFYGLSEPEIA